MPNSANLSLIERGTTLLLGYYYCVSSSDRCLKCVHHTTIRATSDEARLRTPHAAAATGRYCRQRLRMRAHNRWSLSCSQTLEPSGRDSTTFGDGQLLIGLYWAVKATVGSSPSHVVGRGRAYSNPGTAVTDTPCSLPFLHGSVAAHQ